VCCGVVVAVNLFAVVLVEQDSQHEISADIPGFGSGTCCLSSW